uniref:Uncharacterized protein n=1 Tax=Chenopodium quinoa TaxID=63459 RepID=A0A803L8W8_CHEQI
MAKEAETTGGEIMLFGVRVVVDSLRKSVSLNNLSQYEHRLDSSSSNDVVGKGDWRGISRNFVKTRTPTQVASHAQKYFLRRNNLNRRRRRSSLFDITTDSVVMSTNSSTTSSKSMVDFDLNQNDSSSLSLSLSLSMTSSDLANSRYPAFQVMQGFKNGDSSIRVA